MLASANVPMRPSLGRKGMRGMEQLSLVCISGPYPSLLSEVRPGRYARRVLGSPLSEGVDFEECVAEALASVPDGLREFMSNVELVVEDEPRGCERVHQRQTNTYAS